MSGKQSSPIRLKRLPHAHDLPAPRRMTVGSSGSDVVAAVDDRVVLRPGERALIPTGFCFEIPEGYEIQVRPRSGLAYKHGITVLNAPGTIDSDYRGEVKIILGNMGRTPYSVRRGDRIAQLVPARVASEVTFEEVAQLNETERGDGGFGSSGN